MITRMAKVEVAGPQNLLDKTLTFFQEEGVLQIEDCSRCHIGTLKRAKITPAYTDKEVLSEKLFLEKLVKEIGRLFSYLPGISDNGAGFDRVTGVEKIAAKLEKDAALCKELFEKKQRLENEQAELEHYRYLFEALRSVTGTLKETPDLDFIGLTIKDPGVIDSLRMILSEITENNFELKAITTDDGKCFGLIVTLAGFSEKVRKSLHQQEVPELAFPQSIRELSFADKIGHITFRLSTLAPELDSLQQKLQAFADKRGGYYASLRKWAENRLSVLKVTASVYETDMCFVLYGWMPEESVDVERQKLEELYGGRVVINELDILEKELDSVPVLLRNPAYFRPFELFTRFIPLPLYTSYDPTLFIGIFFPVFFGMILGDAGDGLIILLGGVLLYKKFKSRRIIHDASLILMVCSAYAILFGLLFGEIFGDIGHTALGLEPLLFDRRTAILPFIYFALTVGTMHILLGILLGAVNALKTKSGKLAVHRLLNLFMIVSILALVASFLGLLPEASRRPVLIVIAFLAPFFLFTGGFLAPLELIKSIGNIISYARMMAIGLTSVYLAYVANKIAGMAGNIAVGIIAAGLLHLFNLILGVFSPTIHSIRLHFVEFFSKFLTQGGRAFEPLKKE